MPRSSVSPESQMLAELSRLMSKGPLPYQKSGGVFSAKSLQHLGEKARNEGLIQTEERQIRSGRRSSKVVYATITPAGIQRVLEANSPKAALETLVPLVQRLAQPQPENQVNLAAEVQQAFQANARAFETAEDTVQKINDAIKRSLDEFKNSLDKAVEKVEKSFTKALPKDFPKSFESSFKTIVDTVTRAAETNSAGKRPELDINPVLAALKAAAERVQLPAMPAPATVQPTPPAIETTTSGHAIDSKTIGDAIVAIVNQHAALTTVGLPFDELYKQLTKIYPDLTIGQFHDALRLIHQADRIRLGGWPRMLEEMPDPELALFIRSKVIYYAKPL